MTLLAKLTDETMTVSVVCEPPTETVPPPLAPAPTASTPQP